ncbi:MAG: dephospho-CoA kinase [Bacteroidota bacterium]
MIKVGLTGGIGSGKTYVADVFRLFKVPVFDSDTEAKLLYKRSSVREKLIPLFGENIYFKNQINKELLADIVFQDATKLKSLEEILYPELEQVFEEWCEIHATKEYVIKEAAVMIEKGSYQKLDHLILVKADKELRISRVMKRNDISRVEVENRMQAQWSDEEKEKYCDFIIENNEEESLLKQVWKIHRALLPSN